MRNALLVTILAACLSVQAFAHAATLNWTGSIPACNTGGVLTYNAYRGTVNGGPYSSLTTGLTSPTFVDSTVSNGTIYYYVVTGVCTFNSTAYETGYSNQVTAEIPPIVAPPAFTAPPPGNYSTPQTPTITSPTVGATICYRTDGTPPTAPTPGTCGAGSTTLTNGATISVGVGTTTILAMATMASAINSSYVTATYVVNGSTIENGPAKNLFAGVFPQ